MPRKKQVVEQQVNEPLVGVPEPDDYAHGLGKVTVAPEVLLSIARLAALQVEGVSRMSTSPPGVNRLLKKGYGEGAHVEIEGEIVTADIYVVVKNGVNLRETSRNIQREVCRAISEMVGMPVARVNIHIEDIDFTAESEG